MLTERSIINFLLWTVGLIVGPYLAVTSLWGNYVPVLLALSVAIVVLVFACLRDRLCAFPLIGTYCGGRFNFLPMTLSPTDLALLALLAYYAITYLALKRKLMRRGPLLLFIPIIAIGTIVMLNEPNFGMKIFGGVREGGRGSLFMALATLTYLCGVSMNSPSPKFLSRIPIYCVLGSLFFSIPYVVTTYLPAAAPYFYLFADNINISAYSADVMNTDGIVRNQSQASIGAGIILCLLAYVPVMSWWRPQRWWMIIVSAACLGLVVMGGYRNALATFSVMAFSLLWCQIRWRALFFIPIAVLGVVLLITAHSSRIISLPISAQRTLDFLPGNWDPGVVEDTSDSNDFRTGIIHIYNQEYASAHPWLGNGLSFDTATFDMYGFLSQYHDSPDHYFLYKQFITAKMFHTGYLSMYDSVGIIGSLCYILLCLRLIYLTGRSVFGKEADKKSLFYPVKSWLFAMMVGNVFAFFTVFGDIKILFPYLCFVALVWFHIDHVDHAGFQKVPRSRKVPLDAARPGVPVPA